MSTTDDNMCAACGNESDVLKACTACKLVKYCNSNCQRANWKNHKKECKKRAAELHDEALFKQPPSREECDICMVTLPLDTAEQKYQSCCGKVLCYGCIHAAYTADNRRLCPFCRTPEAVSEGETLERLKKRIEADDADAIHELGCAYNLGNMGVPQDREKANKLLLRAGELGYARGYLGIADAYFHGNGVERDAKKAKHYCELAAMGGDVQARHNLGVLEWDAGNMHKAMKHFMISAAAGYDQSLEEIKECFMDGRATKDDFEIALRAHKAAKDEMKSGQRDKAAARAVARG